MGKPAGSSSTGDIWHLSIDDLLAPPPQTTRLGGAGPFVINLSSSTAPISVPAVDLEGGHSLQMYQIRRLEDGRARYRLRLGPFVREDDADAHLAAVRERYPGALLATAGPDDLSAIAATSPQAKAPKRPPAARAAEPKATITAPCTVNRVTPPPIAKLTAAAAAPVRDVKEPQRAAPPRGEPSEEAARSIESTQTLRPLTLMEMADGSALRWYVVQLSLSEEPVDPDTVPNLDIFSLYRLYAVAGLDHGRIVYALRLGFFGEEIAARAVANYLAEYYQAASVKRISVAERDRFAAQRVEARKNVGATGRHAAIEITDELVIRPAKSRGARR